MWLIDATVQATLLVEFQKIAHAIILCIVMAEGSEGNHDRTTAGLEAFRVSLVWGLRRGGKPNNSIKSASSSNCMQSTVKRLES